MAGWVLDEKRYREEVFKAMAEGWRPSEDLFRCYQLPVDVEDDELIALAVKRVQSHVNGARREAEWATVLRRQHAKAKETLTTPALREAHRRQVVERRQELVPLVEAEVAGLPAVPTAAVTRLAARVAPRFARADVEAVLDGLGLTRRDPVPLPPRSRPPSAWSEVRGALAALEPRRGDASGYTSLRHYLLETFSSLQVSQAYLVDRKKKSHADRRGDAATFEAKVLVAAMKWLEDGLLESLLRGELLDQLDSLAHFGLARVRKEIQQPDVLGVLLPLGLPTDPGELAYAVVCAARYPAEDPAVLWRADVDAALASRDLRRALSLLDAQAELPPDAARQRDDARRRLSEFEVTLARARELEVRDAEAAAQLYLDVARELDAPEVTEGLAKCPPAPPGAATAVVEAHRVVITWTPSPARAGDVSYRVLRGEGTRAVAGAGSPVLDAVRAHEAADASPPDGVLLHYSVVAVRNGTVSRTAAHAAPVVLVRDVERLEVRGGQGFVEGTWRLPRGATGARVERTEWRGTGRAGSAPATPVVLASATGDSFRDRTVRDGTTYEYRVQAEYGVAGGAVHRSPGVTARAHSQQRPVPVDDLAYELQGEVVVVTWTPPPAGDVEVRLLDQAPATEAGRVVPVASLRSLGTVVRALGSTGSGGMQAAAPAHTSRHWLLPVTLLDDLAALGRPVELSRALPPVAGLRAQRLGSTARLTWQWPPQVGEVQVHWTTPVVADPGEAGGGARTVTLASYQQQGVTLPVGPGRHTVSVSAIAYLDGVRVVGPPRTATVAVPLEIAYDVVREGWRGRRTRLAVEAVPGVVLPDVHLLAKEGVPPQGPDDGSVLLVLPSSGRAGEPMDGAFTLPAHRRTLHLRAFAPAGDAVSLVPRHPDQLRVT